MESIQGRFHWCLPAEGTQPLNGTNDFFKTAQNYLEQYTRKDKRVLRAVIRHLHLFHAEKELPFHQLTRTFCTSFLHYLYQQLKGNTPISYFKRFRGCLDYCTEERLLTENPAKGIRLAEREEMTKEILTEEEVYRLSVTPCRREEVKYAFLFSCYSGLRWCDVAALCHGQVNAEQRKLTLVQQKVAQHSKHACLQLNLNESALRLIKFDGLPHQPADRVFSLPSYPYALRVLKEWVEKAGISKHISFHCARHTFVSALIAKGTNLKTASLLAGHSTTKHTERYIHILDEQKQRAVDSLHALPDSCFNKQKVAETDR